ncbi:hypothetical protein P170DRAFT_424436 [Aspergillus steynii IBT 23096]|uniref:Uncharacterized protein n=1 Tax=Aspergillus steynii IBT 23096 TaxID=1392250 RepID=A0A2I2GAU9_9EURO|nr:uncharacterized protein P170DRAFT_424436 [Aspergillus steynii IBT 23096]PLB50008.1 hypothetical protein P170DRAFT_424436 [Aspergillus steynii IBT 23096]
MGNRRKSKAAGKDTAKKRRSPRLAKKRSSPSPPIPPPPKEEPPAPAPDPHADTESNEPEGLHLGPLRDECLWFGTGPVKEYKRWGPLKPCWSVDYPRIEKVAGEMAGNFPWIDNEPSTWQTIEDEHIAKQLFQFAFDWAVEHAIRQEGRDSVEDFLSADQKQAILDGLDGYCITKEWDRLLEYLPEKTLHILPTLLVQALVSKATFDTMLANPFFFVDTVDNQTDEVDHVAPPLAVELYKTWRHIRKSELSSSLSLLFAYSFFRELIILPFHSTVNILGAEEWRSTTIRLFNDTTNRRCYNESIILRTVQHRKSIVKRLAEHLLSENHPLHPLLRPLTDPDEIKRRFDVLVSTLERVAILAVWVGTEPRGLLLTPINRHPCYDAKRSLSTTHWLSEVAEEEVDLTGRYPVLVTRPLMHRLDMTGGSDLNEVFTCAAEVVVSKPLRPDQIVGFQDDSRKYQGV